MTPDDATRWLQILLAIAALAATIGLCLPGMLIASGVARYQVVTHGGPADLEPIEEDGVHARKFRQLRALGFEPLGVFEEIIPLKRPTPEHAFVRHSDKAMATIFGIDRGAPLVMFGTVTTDDGVVKTADFSRESLVGPTLILQGAPGESLAAVLDHHVHAVDRFLAPGRTVRAMETLEDFAEYQRLGFENPTMKRFYRDMSLVALGVKAAFLATPTFLVAHATGWSGTPGLLPWLTLLAACLAFRALEIGTLRRLSKS
jgi:hypothetical protein